MTRVFGIQHDCELSNNFISNSFIKIKVVLDSTSRLLLCRHVPYVVHRELFIESSMNCDMIYHWFTI